MVTLSFTVHLDNGLDSIIDRLNTSCTQAEHELAKQVMADTRPFVPWLNGMLDNNTYVKGRCVVYNSNYARYLYKGLKMIDPETGRGPMHFIDKNLEERIVFRKGAKLKATTIPLNIRQRSGHRQAQSHWFEGSKAQNLESWDKKAARLLMDGLKKR